MKETICIKESSSTSSHKQKVTIVLSLMDQVWMKGEKFESFHFHLYVLNLLHEE